MTRIKGIVWVGTRTPRFAEMRAFLERLTGEAPWIDEAGFAVFDVAGGDRLEVFDEKRGYDHFDAPVVGFLVDDVDAARAELEADGVRFLGETGRAGDGNAWAHFRAPDGHVYELTSRPDHPLHRR